MSRDADLVRACVNSLLRHCPEISDHAPRLIVVNDSPEDSHLTELLREY